MAFCRNCGANMEEGTKYCPTCGAPVGEPINQDVNPIGGDNSQNYQAQGNFGAGATNNPGDDVTNNKAYGILAYIWILFLVPLLAAPNSKFAKFHANQGLVLFLASLICGLISIIPILGWLICFAGNIFLLVCSIMGIINAARGEMKELPLIGSIKLIT